MGISFATQLRGPGHSGNLIVTLQLSFRYAFFVQGRSVEKLALAFATVLRDMLFQPCNGHRHSHRQLPLFSGLQFAEPHQPPHPVPRLDELAFEPSMFRTSYRQPRRRAHPAPVENRERQITTKANKKQTLFFRLLFASWISAIVRSCKIPAPSSSPTTPLPHTSSTADTPGTSDPPAPHATHA